MLSQSSFTTRISSSIVLLGCLLSFSALASAQRRPTIIEPKARTESIPVKAIKAAPPTKGTLIVLFSLEVPGKITIETLAGKLVEEGATDETGQAQFFLKRGQSYRVKGSAPGFIGDQKQTKAVRGTETILLNLTAKSATVNLVDLPSGAQVLIDNQPQPAVDKSGALTITDLPPGKHKLSIKHPEYRDFQGELPELKAGTTMIYPVALDKVAKLTILGLSGARVLIDGAFQGTIQADGKVLIDYQIDQISERTIAVELIGYQTWSKRELLTPGPRTVTVSLDPVITPAGVTDFFDTLSLWLAPPTWKVLAEGNNRRLQVKGEQLGTLADKTYRDFRGNFTVWLEDGKGATWAVRADKEGRNYYLFHLAGPKSTSHTPKRFYTYLVKDGGPPVEVSTPVPVLVDLTQPGSYTISITVESHTIKHSIVGNHKVEESDLGIWTDTTTTKDRFLYGSFGFRSLSGEIFQVDDLNLEPIKEK